MSPLPPPAFAQLRARMLVLAVLWVLLLSALGGFTVWRQQAMAETLDTVYRDRILAQAQLKVVGDALGRQALDAVAALQTGRGDPVQASAQAAAQLAQARQLAGQNWQRYLQTRLVDDEARLVAQAGPLLAQAEQAVGEAQRLLAAGDHAGLRDWASAAWPDAVAPLLVVVVVDELFALQVRVAADEVANARIGSARASQVLLVLVVAGCLLGGTAAWALFVNHTRAAEHNERALRRLNAFYTALSRTNHLILHAKDETTLLRELCEVCVETGHAAVTAVFLVDGTQVKRVANAGPQAEFFRTFPATWSLDAPAYRLSMTVTALTTGMPHFGPVASLAGNSSPWRDLALSRGIRAVAAFPLRRAGRVCGSLSLYATDADCFDEELVKLLTEMAADVSFALENLDRETSRVQLEQETRAGLARFRKIFQSSPVACVIAAVGDATVLEINDVMCTRYGVRREDVLGQSRGRLGTLLVEADAQRYRDELQRQGRVHNLFGRTPLPDGGMADVIVNAETIDYQGQACVMAMLLDVTELRAAESARQARATAEAANRAKTTFLSQISHELRTPLNAMLGFTQLVQRDAGSRLLPQDLSQLEHIRRSGWHLLSLINDVMDVSRIEAGQFQIQLGPVPLATLVQQVLQMTAPAAQAAGVVLHHDPTPCASLAVQADPVRLRQVLINLLSNAVKYNRPGGSVQVDVQHSADQVVLAVRDTGLGMSADQLQHLYEPFNRLGHEHGGIEGTGLGLALTRQLVGLMGGTLGFESQPGRGTTARLCLPAAAAADPPPDGPVAATAPTGTVLYIEDNEINVMVVEQMLSRWAGVRFVHAGNGQAGIAQAAALQPDLVLLDMHLPDMNGVQVLQRLRQQPDTAALRVVVLSAGDAPDEVAQLLAEGAVDYWTKPVELDRFLSGMARQLGAGNAEFSRPQR
ncbi:MAG: response regulator [Rubrivivax sp.]|nr:response regulator [Rubrivivax sp.]